MKIILGCDPLLQPLTVIGHYTHNLAAGLCKCSDVEKLEFFAHGKFFSDAILNGDGIDTGVSTEPLSTSLYSKARQSLAKSTTAVKLYKTIQPIISKFALRNHSDFIFHSPNFFLPKFDGIKITTIHDLSTVRYPEFHPKARIDFVNNAITKALTDADHIITDSEFIRNELVSLMGGKCNKISVIPLGADKEFHPRDEKKCVQILNQYQIHFKNYFLFVSTIEPRKNLKNLLDAFSGYRQKVSNGLPLILVGGVGWNNRSIFNQIQELESKGWIKYMGYVPQQHIPILYAGAKALLFPSIYEGFGLPVLEAMQSGTPVLTCINSSMSEISGESAALVAEHDVELMSHYIEKFDEDSQWCEKLSLAGILRSENFSWEKCVKETIKLYESLG